MPVLIDGYNLLHASGILGGSRRTGPGALERSREALLNVLVESLPDEELTRTTVVFDAHDPPWGLSRQLNHRGLTVHFASRHQDADSMIEELIKAHSTPRKLVVVSSDHRLHRAARKRRATPIDSDRWFRELLRMRFEKPAISEGAKPEGPFSADEVEFWLRQFETELPGRKDSESSASP
jgi:uncharacterized protein